MKILSYSFYYPYVVLLLIAGFWGAFINPYFDFNLLFDLDPQTLADYGYINLFSQYRFLRALEFGFGLFSILYTRMIFTKKSFNILFLVIMGSGILARVMSWIVEGTPNGLMQFFMFHELTGWILIFIYTFKIRYKNAD
ncbi:DUF4345 family protein [Saccharicrinis sp. GN24d3]|uniref:DUF4345 family protein n=1 Tax=Saccharicrinis sp. GN24d3 TaxID=3458416 RepID=UPI0040354546